MRELDLISDEYIGFDKLNEGIVQPSKTSINPYYRGLKMLKDIEERYNNPTEQIKKLEVKPSSCREKIFEVRELESDTSFIRNYLKKELVHREDMYLFQRQGRNYKIVDKDWTLIQKKASVSYCSNKNF